MFWKKIRRFFIGQGKMIGQEIRNQEYEIEHKWSIHPASPEEWGPAMKLAWRTFLRFEAGDYTNEGIRHFKEFVDDERLKKLFLKGIYHLYVATEDNQIVGMISLRDETHISLLFVDVNYHKQGIGRCLINYLREEIRAEKKTFMTVNASPYGLGFYKKIGFVETDKIQDSNGILFTPMILYF